MGTSVTPYKSDSAVFKSLLMSSVDKENKLGTEMYSWGTRLEMSDLRPTVKAYNCVCSARSNYLKAESPVPGSSNLFSTISWFDRTTNKAAH